MNRLAFDKKIECIQLSRVDRFVRPRASLMEVTRRWSWQDDNDTIKIQHMQRKMYKNHLDEAFGLPRPEPAEAVWPCRPRSRACLSSIDSILDLPNYRYATFPELLDWSSAGFLVAALGCNYHMYSWRLQKVSGVGWSRDDIMCCKFDPRGHQLVIGTSAGSVEIHHCEWSMCLLSGQCACSSYGYPCSITALAWSPTGNSFISGCSRGTVTTFDRCATAVHNFRFEGERAPILVLRVSPDARYVAVVPVNSVMVVVLTWPGLRYHLSLECAGIVKTIAWHPWRSAQLGVARMGANLDAKVILWDPPAGKVQQTIFRHHHCTIDVMLFSHRTGELVLSLWDDGIASIYPKSSSQLVVMSDPYTVVDNSEKARGLDRIRTMVFSPCGTKLATASIDEDLIIWKFLPEDKKHSKHLNASRRFSALPAYLDEVTHGFVLR